jgi:glycosyltransferase involved in cell wall biosynthesis
LSNKKKQIVSVVHGSELDIKSTIPRSLTSYALSKANTIIAVSRYTQKFLPTELPSTINKRVIHNGINSDEFSVNEMNRLQGEPALITVGSVTARKGQENVINALPEIKAKYPNVHYHIVGKPQIREKLQIISTQLKVKEAITYYGAVDRSELLRTLSGATIKLMLSNHTSDGDFEGFGIAVLEANAFGIPVIGSRNSGIEDAIVHEKTGLLVNPKDALEITSAVTAILGNYSFFSQNAKQWALEHDWKNIVEQYEKALNLN